MNKQTKQEWIKQRTGRCGLAYDPIRSRAIANVRAAQEAELERFRESIDQDELEVAEFDRLVKKEADRIFGSAKKETRDKELDAGMEAIGKKADETIRAAARASARRQKRRVA